MEFLKGIRIYNYRSIDSEGVELDKLGKVNVLIGKNNSGKSNILRFISYLSQLIDIDFGQAVRKHTEYKNDLPNFDAAKMYDFAIKHNKSFIKEYKDQVKKNILEGLTIDNHSQEIWFKYNYSLNENLFSPDFYHFTSPILNSKAKNNEGNSSHFLNGLLDFSKNYILSHPTYLIENYRKVDNDKKDNSIDKSVQKRSEVFNGKYFIQELKNVLYYEATDYHFAAKEKLFKNFLKDILNNPNLEISISISNSIQLKLSTEDHSLRPIENLGTGLHQLILLAFAVTNIENSIFCIEEPEIFIHPEVQRKFIRYLVENTNNQYFITTHSNAFINEEGLDIYRVWHNGNRTLVEKAIDSNSKNHILDDLGYQASDLLQTNFIIWVEGPSDRIYIRHWISIESNDKLIEGIHYTIMFYGGRLLSHLTIEENDDEVSNFININKINRNAAIFIDSDKKEADEIINATKERMITEFTTQKKQHILTKGREIENYIDIETLNAALTKINRPTLSEYDLFTDIFIEKNIDKMKLAKAVVEISNEVFDVGGLKENIKHLVASINKANNLAI